MERQRWPTEIIRFVLISNLITLKQWTTLVYGLLSTTHGRWLQFLTLSILAILVRFRFHDPTEPTCRTCRKWPRTSTTRTFDRNVSSGAAGCPPMVTFCLSLLRTYFCLLASLHLPHTNQLTDEIRITDVITMNTTMDKDTTQDTLCCN